MRDAYSVSASHIVSTVMARSLSEALVKNCLFHFSVREQSHCVHAQPLSTVTTLLDAFFGANRIEELL